MEERNNTRAHMRMDVEILMQYRRLLSPECEEIEKIPRGEEACGCSPISFSLRPFMEGEGREEELGNIDPFILNALIDINIKINLIISIISSGGQKNIFNTPPVEANLSEGGIGFTTPEDFSEGDLLEIQMILPAFPIAIIKAVGRVIRVTSLPEGGQALGVQFSTIREEDREKIVHYLFKKQRELLRIKKVKTG